MSITNCNHKVQLVAITTFGHGDSSTLIYGQCEFCKAQGRSITIMGFPATHEDLRTAQSLFEQDKLNDQLTLIVR
jgi:hypothetical protein